MFYNFHEVPLDFFSKRALAFLSEGNPNRKNIKSIFASGQTEVKTPGVRDKKLPLYADKNDFQNNPTKNAKEMLR